MKRLILRNLIITFLLAISSLVFSGCGGRDEEVRVDNVVRVFWHEGTLYSFHVREPNSVEIKLVFTHYTMCVNQRTYTNILADVPLGNPMWVYYIINHNWDRSCLKVLEIHIHSEKDIEGGGWNHGKFGRGQTSVIR